MKISMTPTVLVPGMLCSPEIFASQITALWPYGAVTVASTLEGETIAEMAAAILAAAPPRFALAGISMGGFIEFEIMRQAPERVIKLALLSTEARPDTPAQTAQRRTLLAQVDTGNFETLLALALPAIVHPAHQEDPALREANVRMGLAVGIERWARQVQAVMARIDYRPCLPANYIPTLVLVGDSDTFTPPNRAEEMVAAIPGARLVVVPQCGHASTIEQPDAVNRALIEWITG
jgi:pimeloyl-ACP methyl ester carboxylesterase